MYTEDFIAPRCGSILRKACSDGCCAYVCVRRVYVCERMSWWNTKKDRERERERERWVVHKQNWKWLEFVLPTTKAIITTVFTVPAGALLYSKLYTHSHTWWALKMVKPSIQGSNLPHKVTAEMGKMTGKGFRLPDRQIDRLQCNF